jgi:hypothetical protein
MSDLARVITKDLYGYPDEAVTILVQHRRLCMHKFEYRAPRFTIDLPIQFIVEQSTLSDDAET